MKTTTWSIGPLVIGVVAGCSLLVDARHYGEGSDGGERDDGGTADATLCEGPNDTLCSGTCADTNSDPEHCGRCGNACGSGEVCMGGECECATTMCSGACVDTSSDPAHCGGCDKACPTDVACVDGLCAVCEPPEIDCAGATMPLQVGALRVTSGPRDPREGMDPGELHIAAGPSGGSWRLFWRGGDRKVRAAAVTPRSCPAASPPAVVTDEGTELVADRLDVRTNYYRGIDRLNAVTFAVTGAYDGSFATVRLWKVGDDTQFSREEPEAGFPTPVLGVSLVPETRAAQALAVTESDLWSSATNSGMTLPDLTGHIAAGPLSALFGQADGLGRASVSGGGEATVPPDSRVEDLVAAVNPQRTVDLPREHFVVGLAGASTLHKLHCDASNCSGDTSLSAVPRVAGSPIAAYTLPLSGRVGERVTVFAVEREPGPGASLSVVRRTSMTDPQPVLSGVIVGGSISEVLALDAESVRASGIVGEGWDFVWAAFVVVQRPFGERVELWTGAERVCM